MRKRDRSHGLRMRERKDVKEAVEQFQWLMLAKVGEERCAAGEYIVDALNWVLRIGTKDRTNPLPELLQEIRKLRGQVPLGQLTDR